MQAVERTPVSLSILKKDDNSKIVPTLTTCSVPSKATWRGHGGRHPTPSSVEFDRQLDKISLWIEDWNHDQVCTPLELTSKRGTIEHYTNLFYFLFLILINSLIIYLNFNLVILQALFCFFAVFFLGGRGEGLFIWFFSLFISSLFVVDPAIGVYEPNLNLIFCIVCGFFSAAVWYNLVL